VCYQQRFLIPFVFLWAWKNILLVPQRKNIGKLIYKGSDRSLARPASRCILFDGKNISFDASLVIYI
jgi:hypothetical protein